MYLLLGFLFVLTLSLYYFFTFIDRLMDWVDNRPRNNRRIVEDIFTIIEFLFIFLLVFIFGHLFF